MSSQLRCSYSNSVSNHTRGEDTATHPSRNEAHLRRPPNPTANLRPPQLMLAAAVRWLRVCRSRYILLLLCSPILLPFLCLVELGSRLCCCSRRRGKAARGGSDDGRLRMCEEGGIGEAGEFGLLQRYLEDQLMLVGSVYECGGAYGESDGDDGGGQTRTPLLA